MHGMMHWDSPVSINFLKFSASAFATPAFTTTGAFSTCITAQGAIPTSVNQAPLSHAQEWMARAEDAATLQALA